MFALEALEMVVCRFVRFAFEEAASLSPNPILRLVDSSGRTNNPIHLAFGIVGCLQ
jgi:hypothetical protein